jgi:hypothetical protein
MGKIATAMLTYSMMAILLVIGTLVALVCLLTGCLSAVARNIDPPSRPWFKDPTRGPVP